MNRVDSVSLRVEEKATSPKRTVDGGFAAFLKSGAQVLSGAVTGSLALASPVIPGAAGVSAALGSASAIKGALMGAAGEQAPGLAAADPGTGVDGIGALGGGGWGAGDVMEATKRLQEQNQMFSMQYLELQEKIQQENRQYSTISNVLKTRHESAKTAIGNIR
jgi:hypothetical protein